MSSRAPSASIEAVLLDIEGTTTPIAFVVDVLFPYARRHLRRHLAEHGTSPDYEVLVEQLRDEHAADAGAAESVPAWVDSPIESRLVSVASYVEWLMDRDRKSTPLKALQGRIWDEGYRRGDLVGEVFPDVPAAFARWHAAGLTIGIFSSGSVLAQELLFRYSSAGDLTGFLTRYFDTTVGGKAAADSYRRIAAAIGLDPGSIVFISDVTKEIDAAASAGMQTRLAVRPGNASVSPGHGHTVLTTFDGLAGSTPRPTKSP